jgi:hypothetical protein
MWLPSCTRDFSTFLQNRRFQPKINKNLGKLPEKFTTLEMGIFPNEIILVKPPA